MNKMLTCLVVMAAFAPAIGRGEIINQHVNGSLLLLEDDERSDPIAIDLSNPNVQAIISDVRNHNLPNDWGALLPHFEAADPQMYTRCTQRGMGTSMGKVYPGFTVQPRTQKDCPHQ